MTIIFVWLPIQTPEGKLFGHASMNVSHTYMSWWPAEEPSIRGQHSVFRKRTFEEDIKDEGRKPSAEINLVGLNEKEILYWWAGLGLEHEGKLLHGPLLPYELTNRNCSSIVADGLKVGGADKFADWSKRWNLIWHPEDVLHYANSIKRGLLHAVR